LTKNIIFNFINGLTVSQGKTPPELTRRPL